MTSATETSAVVPVEAQAVAHVPSGREVIAAAQEDAKELAAVINQAKAYSVIEGKKHVHVDGWTTLAAMKGCMVREVEAGQWLNIVSGEPDGWEATVELVRISDGVVISRASAMAGQRDDIVSKRTGATWADRPSYAQRSMAITRAAGKVCRIAFSWIMVLTEYSPTPLEEMPQDVEPTRKPATSKPTPAEEGEQSPPISQDMLDQICSAAKAESDRSGSHPFRVIDGTLEELGYEPSPKGTKTWAAMVKHLRGALSEGDGARVVQYIEDAGKEEVF